MSITDKKTSEFRMYRESAPDDKNVVLVDYTTAKIGETSAQFLARVQTNADELSKRIFGGMLFTRCRKVSWSYTVSNSDADGFEDKRYVTSERHWPVPDMKRYPTFPAALLRRAAAAAADETGGEVVAIAVHYHNSNPKPKDPNAPKITAAPATRELPAA